MRRRRRLSFVGMLAVLAMVAGQGMLGAADAQVLHTAPSAPADKALFFSSDGMRPDALQKYVNLGAMPTYAQLIADGVKGDNGLLPAFPPNTGVGWYTLMTGTWPSEHGSTNNTYFRSGDTFSNRTSFSAAGTMQADTLAAAAERAGKTVAQINWVGGANSGIAGPTVDFATFYSNRGIVVPANNAADAASAATFGVNYLVSAPAPASGWTHVKVGDPVSPPMQAQFTIPTTFGAQNPSRTYDLYFYDRHVDGVEKYSNVLMVPSAAGKNGALADAALQPGQYESIRLSGANGLTGTRAGESAGFHVKLISLANNLSSYKIYFTSIARAIATCSTAACDALPAGVAGENRLEKYIADNLPPWSEADFAAEEAGLIDEDTYVQQGRELQVKFTNAVEDFILGTLQPNTDLAFVGYPATDEFQHQFLGLTVKKDMDGTVNPFYDDANGDHVADGRVSKRKGYLKSSYVQADKLLRRSRKLLDAANPTSVTTFASSDHGFAPQWWAINANQILNAATVHNTSTNTDQSLHASNASASNCSAATSDYTKACWAGGTTQVYINTTLPAGVTYNSVRQAVRDAFNNLADPSYPGKQVLQAVMNKEDLRNVQGDDSLHPNRSGDVVVVSRPPYQFDAPTAGVAIAWSHFFGQHGYLPNTVDQGHEVDMHSVFVASGPGVVESSTPVGGVRAIDLAPTIAYLMRIPGPIQARGRILYDITKGGSDVTEATILTISDFHGQLTPITEVADPGLAASQAFGLGGAAFLKPWLDWYRADATDGSITITGGDSVGASPAISSYFGDTPAMDMLNLMGVSGDTLGNHNFDRGQDYLRNTLIPIAHFPYMSANVVDAGGNTPAEWSPSHVYDFNGTKLGVIGFELPDLTSLVFPGNVDPFHVTDPATAINTEAANLHGQGVNAILAAGHMGMSGGTIFAPDPSASASPVFPVADALTGVDAIVGGHTHTEYVTWRNGMSVTENQNATARFTRVRLVIDKATDSVIYETADFHRPWDIGVTPDPTIQAEINDLNAQLSPILSGVIANSTVYVPRSDSCSINTGRIDGRGCESLVGDTVADGMLATYSGIGADFAITNSGGLRADLTCPTVDVSGDFCAAYSPPPYPITKGSVLGVLPFGNLSTTTPLHGDGLKAMLENGVSLIGNGATPNTSQGRFPQISGLCFTYDITQNPGSRVTSAVYANPDGSCGATPVDLTAGSPEYVVVQNDFMSTGGDGYPNVKATSTTQNLMDQDVATYLQNHSQPLSPTIQGRITCTQGSGPQGANVCPVTNP